MIDAYLKHEAERRALGIPPKPLDPEQTRQVCELLESPPADAKLPPGVDFMLEVSVESVSVDKRFTPERTIHGQYFRMKSEVRLNFTLTPRAAAPVTGEISGIEEEPPTPKGGEVFLPLETEPAESLSVAMSRAVGQMLIDPRLRAVLPTRSGSAH